LPLMEIAANLQDWDTLYFYGYAAGYETSGYDGVFGELTWNRSGEGITTTAVRAHRRSPRGSAIAPHIHTAAPIHRNCVTPVIEAAAPSTADTGAECHTHLPQLRSSLRGI
jgi:hypothetical protein